ncbi:MAG TPA: hypothetical protein VK915_00655 [Gaiellaceae bacterium]|nr:hypothetical protein [Gaiellaceae bacterium]
MERERQGWPWFLAWAFAGGSLFFAVLSGFSIGLLVLPFALAAVWLVGRACRPWPELLGGASGAGLVLLAVAFLNRDATPCPESGELTVQPGQTSITCGGSDPVPWLVAGGVLLAAGAAAYALARTRSPGPSGKRTT